MRCVVRDDPAPRARLAGKRRRQRRGQRSAHQRVEAPTPTSTGFGRDRRDVLRLEDLVDVDVPDIVPVPSPPPSDDTPEMPLFSADDVELPRAIEGALLHALCRQRVWQRCIDVGRARRLVLEAVAAPNDEIDLAGLFAYLDDGGRPGLAARCVRDVAHAMTEAGWRVRLPQQAEPMRLSPLRVNLPARRADGTSAVPIDRLERAGAAWAVDAAAVAWLASGVLSMLARWAASTITPCAAWCRLCAEAASKVPRPASMRSTLVAAAFSLASLVTFFVAAA